MTSPERINNFIEHHGIKGQRWGLRRYQNEDGSLTEAGRKRYDKPDKEIKKLAKLDRKQYKAGKKTNNLNSFTRNINPVMYDFIHTKRASRLFKKTEKYFEDHKEVLNRQMEDPRNAQYKKRAALWAARSKASTDESKFWISLAMSMDKNMK